MIHLFQEQESSKGGGLFLCKEPSKLQQVPFQVFEGSRASPHNEPSKVQWVFFGNWEFSTYIVFEGSITPVDFRRLEPSNFLRGSQSQNPQSIRRFKSQKNYLETQGTYETQKRPEGEVLKKRRTKPAKLSRVQQPTKLVGETCNRGAIIMMAIRLVDKTLYLEKFEYCANKISHFDV